MAGTLPNEAIYGKRLLGENKSMPGQKSLNHSVFYELDSI
jgi:hypothetical protein